MSDLDAMSQNLFGGIDISNVIASGTGILPYTATGDCYAVLSNQSNDISFYLLNGTYIAGVSTQSTVKTLNVVPLKKGDVLTYRETGGNLTHTIDIYGIKR